MAITIRSLTDILLLRWVGKLDGGGRNSRESFEGVIVHHHHHTPTPVSNLVDVGSLFIHVA